MTEFIDTNTNTNNNTNTTMSSYFSKAFTAFNTDLSLPDNCVPFTGAKFGLLNLEAVTSSPSDIEHELILVIDNSGSMGDQCSGDNDKTQMDQAIHTLKNIVGYLEEKQNIKANVTIYKFDDKFIKVVDRTSITEVNYKSIEQKINKIRPCGGTDIGLALRNIQGYINELKTLYPTHQISHIFMTDGEVTYGEKKPNILKQLIVRDVYNYFIGYGSKHDSGLLRTLSDFEKSSYHYIDAIEKAGFVFGEILHNITHKVLYNCEIVVENGVVYNYKTNLYTNKLYIGDIIAESNKVYHLFTDHSTSCYVHLKMPLEPLEIHLFQETEHTLNFVNYAFRHRTLTLLGEVKQCQEKYDNSSRYKYDENYFGYENISTIKSKMQELFDEMRLYMRNNDVNDKFIKMLCDDIHIAMKTIGTRYGQMCISSRQTSQGTQRIYTVNTTPLDRVKVTVNVNTRSSTYDSDSDSDEEIPQRAPMSCSNNDSDSDSENIQRASMSACAQPKSKQRACAPSSLCIEPDTSDEYEVSNDCMIDSPYLTQTVTSVMRTISNISDEDSEEEDNDEEDNDEEDNDKNDSDEDNLVNNNNENEKITGLFQDTPVKIDNNNIGPLTEF